MLLRNIIVLFVSSDDFTPLIWGWKTANMDYKLYIYICIKIERWLDATDIYIYIYIYIYMYIYTCECGGVFGKYSFVNTYLIKQCRNPLSAHFCIYPVETTHHASLWYQFNSATSKRHSCPKVEFHNILTENTTILEQQNNKQKLQIHEALHIRKKYLNSTESIMNAVLIYLNVLSYCCYI